MLEADNILYLSLKNDLIILIISRSIISVDYNCFENFIKHQKITWGLSYIPYNYGASEFCYIAYH